MKCSYVPRPAAEVTIEDLIATVSRDHDDIATFEARREFTKRCGGYLGGDWRIYAPATPRSTVTLQEGGKVNWNSFVEEGLI